eukprot:1235974-Amphidinium_carterae.1
MIRENLVVFPQPCKEPLRCDRTVIGYNSELELKVLETQIFLSVALLKAAFLDVISLCALEEYEARPYDKDMSYKTEQER